MHISEKKLTHKAFHSKIPTSRSLKPNQAILPLANDFNLGIIGGAGSGKTTAAIGILNTIESLEGKFTKVFWVSPTATIDEKTKKYDVIDISEFSVVEAEIRDLLETQENAKKEVKLLKARLETLRRSPRAKTVQARLSVVLPIAQANLRFLIVCDDLSGTRELANPRTPLLRFCLQRRHLRSSMMFLAQAYKTISKTIRLNFTDLALLRNLNADSLAGVTEEFAHPQIDCLETLDSFYKFATQKPYDYLLLMQQPGVLRKNKDFSLYCPGSEASVSYS